MWELPGYKVGDVLGSGAFGEVRVGLDRHSSRKVSPRVRDEAQSIPPTPPRVCIIEKQ